MSQEGIGGLDDEYDMVIVGSGYGGSVVAANLIKANPGAKICVLERGKEYHPGDFPKDFRGFLNSLRGPLNRLGLVDTNIGNSDDRDLDIISASGLGGTSLLNAGNSESSRTECLHAKRMAERNTRSRLQASGQLLPGQSRPLLHQGRRDFGGGN